ncbi:MAG TPA: YidC/Oxa1 family membrane protein insertase [Candidatus Nanoarchaeia archaeon]|nr:YidC/Oxa1 family membrane protein insertase [Candidatus Nanoarchaeia archaeon]
MSFLYHTLVYNPLYNGLIYLMDVLPWADAGVAIVIFTIIVKLILFPLSKKAVTTQLKMKKVEPELNALKEKYKDDKQLHAKKTMELYKDNGINPFAGIILILIQLPIILALYKVFLSGFQSINADILYSFVKVPAAIDTMFLGLVDITGKSVVLALLAGISSFIQVKLSIPVVPKTAARENMSKEERFRHDLTRTMGMQMRYMLPALAFIVSWTISGAIAVYWITSNVFSIAQELVIRKSIKESEASAK